MNVRTKYFFPSKLFREVLPKLLLERGIEAKGVMHIGAHLGEEVPCYRKMGFARIVLVEPNPVLCAAMTKQQFDVRECVVSQQHGFVDFNIVADDVGSSLLPLLDGTGLTRHVVAGVIKVPSRPLSEVLEPGINVLVVDTQGTALDVVKSGQLDQLDLVVTEVHKGKPLYVGESSWMDVVKHMRDSGFMLVHTFVNQSSNHTYEDLVFAKQP